MLAVGRTFPWPASSGGRMRDANVLTALLPLGELDLFVAARGEADETAIPASVSIRRVRIGSYPVSSLSAVDRLRWYPTSKLPLELVGRDFSTLRESFADFVRGERYDLVWVSRIPSLVAVGALPQAPVIVDIDDLRDDWHTARLVAAGRGALTGLRGILNQRLVQRNASVWKHLQRRVAASAEAAIVCSEADRIRLDLPNAVVVPNGYDRPAAPVGRPSVGDSATIMFQGGLHYPPNLDAARYLVEEIGPLLRERVPRVHVRLVGSASPVLDELGSRPGVTVVGWVPRIEGELERADLVATPIRFGGGTRIKILEAFAHRIPVVSSSLGAYGLDVVDGRHLLLADTPASFADACATLLADETKRRALVEEAERLFLEKYQWCHIADSVRELVLAVA